MVVQQIIALNYCRISVLFCWLMAVFAILQNKCASEMHFTCIFSRVLNKSASIVHFVLKCTAKQLVCLLMLLKSIPLKKEGVFNSLFK